MALRLAHSLPFVLSRLPPGRIPSFLFTHAPTVHLNVTKVLDCEGRHSVSDQIPHQFDFDGVWPASAPPFLSRSLPFASAYTGASHLATSRALALILFFTTGLRVYSRRVCPVPRCPLTRRRVYSRWVTTSSSPSGLRFEHPPSRQPE